MPLRLQSQRTTTARSRSQARAAASQDVKGTEGQGSSIVRTLGWGAGALLGLSLLVGILPHSSALPVAPPVGVSAPVIANASNPSFAPLPQGQSASSSITAPSAGTGNLADPRAGTLPNAGAENLTGAESVPNANTAPNPSANTSPSQAYHPQTQLGGGGGGNGYPSPPATNDLGGLPCYSKGGPPGNYSSYVVLTGPVLTPDFCSGFNSLVNKAKKGILENPESLATIVYHPAYTSKDGMFLSVGGGLEYLQRYQESPGGYDLFFSYGQGACFIDEAYPMSRDAIEVLWYILRGNFDLFARFAVIPEQERANALKNRLTAQVTQKPSNLVLANADEAYKRLTDMAGFYPVSLQELPKDPSLATDAGYIFMSLPMVINYGGDTSPYGNTVKLPAGVGFVLPSVFKGVVTAKMSNGEVYTYTYPALPAIVGSYTVPKLMYFAVPIAGEVEWTVVIFSESDSWEFVVTTIQR